MIIHELFDIHSLRKTYSDNNNFFLIIKKFNLALLLLKNVAILMIEFKFDQPYHGVIIISQ